MSLVHLCAAPGAGTLHERVAAPRPSALDRVAAFALGHWDQWLDSPARNRRLAQPPDASIRHLDDLTLDAHLAAAKVPLRQEGLSGRQAGKVLQLVAEAARRSIGIDAHAEQHAGARLLLRGRLIEMDTGEGKSLTIALAAAVAAFAGLPVDVFTVNAYLAQRDAQAFEPLYTRLGLRVGTLAGREGGPAPGPLPGADVMYVVNKDYVFEHLRFRAAAPHRRFAGRGLVFAIVDEADSILIDEARTPLIVARESTRLDAAVLAAVARHAATLHEGEHFMLEALERRARLRPGAPLGPLRDAGLVSPTWPEPLLRELVEQALAARLLYLRDRDYIVNDGKVAIVDEYTGRVLADRSWERGLHQLIEIGEGLVPTPARETVARTTFPEFFRRYLVLAGASGTLRETAPELRAVYGARVARVPRHLPSRLAHRGLRVFRRADERWAAAILAVQQAAAQGRPVLVGTRSVAASETLAASLAARGLDPAVLNARENRAEAAVIARAGRSGAVTVATNMAGRGTDIVLDEAARAAGGLRVVLTELHESARIDRQLIGRCARQGDPGDCLLFASLQDELFEKNLPVPLLSRLAAGSSPELPRPLGAALRRFAQGLAESRHRSERAQVLERDDGLKGQLGFAGVAS